MFNRIDVLSLASKVSTPTLVLHAKSEVEIPLSQARAIAAEILAYLKSFTDFKSHWRQTTASYGINSRSE